MIDETITDSEMEVEVFPEPDVVPEIPAEPLAPDPEVPAEPDVTLEAPSEPSAPDPEPAVEVISVEELLDRLSGSEDNSQDEIETADLDGELIGEVVKDIVEIDPVIGVVESVFEKVVDVVGDLNTIGKHTESIQRTLDHPALTTPFEDYTVTEGLLLLLLLCVFMSACVKILKGGFLWLR